ncbi:hypothetical protein GR302_20645 [Aeromonas caviae]|nr:hypothetical protein [Aeromonas caviae]
MFVIWSHEKGFIMSHQLTFADSEFSSKRRQWLITSCRSANNIMPITVFLPAFIASFFYSA